MEKETVTKETKTKEYPSEERTVTRETKTVEREPKKVIEETTVEEED